MMTGNAPATLTHQLKNGKIQPEMVIALCRAFGYPPIECLVETGYLSVDDLKGRITVKEALAEATVRELWDAIAEQANRNGLFITKMPRLEDMEFSWGP